MCLALPRPNRDPSLLRHVALARARPDDLAALELHSPIAGPRRDRAGADPAPALPGHHTAFEDDRCDGDPRSPPKVKPNDETGPELSAELLQMTAASSYCLGTSGRFEFGFWSGARDLNPRPHGP